MLLILMCIVGNNVRHVADREIDETFWKLMRHQLVEPRQSRNALTMIEQFAYSHGDSF